MSDRAMGDRAMGDRAMGASAADPPYRAWTAWSRRGPVVIAAALTVLGLLAVLVRLDAPSDGTRAAAWSPGAVTVTVDPPDAQGGLGQGPSTLTDGSVIVTIGGQQLTARPGGLAEPASGSVVDYRLETGDTPVPVRIAPAAIGPMLRYGWGNLVFVVALALLAGALYARRPDEPATAPLLIASAGFLGSTLAIVAGVPALAMATGGALLWLYNLNIVGGYAIAWGAVLAFSLRLPRAGAVPRPVLVGAWAGPPAAMIGVALVAAAVSRDWMGWFGLVYQGTTLIVIGAVVLAAGTGLICYARTPDPVSRTRLRWVAAGVVATTLLSLAGWHLPHLLGAASPLGDGSLGLSGLPFIAGVGIALWRHRLFDLERLANRSLIYLVVSAVLVAGYAVLVALLSGGLGLSGGIAAGVAAAAAALALAPVLRLARRAVNRLMYGERDDPAAVLSRLGGRMQAVPLPDDVLPAVVETVATSLRLPYVAVDLAVSSGEPGGDPELRLAAEHGVPGADQQQVPLRHHGSVVGRLRACPRGVDDPLDATDLALLGSLAAEIGPAVQAVRLHHDLLRSRAEVIALREEERRRLRRDLHDGLGPALAAIGLKAGLAAREVPAGSAAARSLAEIDVEVRESLAGIRRLVEGLRPPTLDELGLVRALRTRAASLAVDLEVQVEGDLPTDLPAAVEAAAYWIGVEAMTNAARHSGGSRCAVELRPGADALVVVVTDDGRGLDPSRPSGVGLRSMQERASEVGGTVAIWSVGAGTEVSARLPLRLAAEGGGGR